MAVMFGHFHKALRSAGVDEDRARRASEELAESTSDVGVMRANIADLKVGLSTVQKDVGALKADVAVLKWMLGFVIAMVLTVLWKLFLGY
jgi:hypothetical protein